MKKSIKALYSQLEKSNAGTALNGFAVLKNLRGGKMLTEPVVTNSEGPCNNTYTCSGSNTKDCTNSGKCESSTNSGICSNSGTCFT